MNNHFLLWYYIKLWKLNTSSAKYDRWCEENHEYIEEEFKKFIN